MRVWLLLPLLLLAACAGRQEPFAATESFPALVRWQRPDSSLVSEAVFARSADGSAMVQIYKSSTTPLLTLSINSQGHLRASGPLARLGWNGPSQSAPVPLSTWARVMEIYRTTASWPNGTREIHGDGTRSVLTIAGKRLTALAVTNDLNGETIAIRFEK